MSDRQDNKQEDSQDWWRPRVGSVVDYTIHKRGTVIEVDDGARRCLVDFGGKTGKEWVRRMSLHLAEVDCPACGDPCGRDEVHNGVGMMYGPWGCACGWSEDEEHDCREGANVDENGYTLDQFGGATPPAQAQAGPMSGSDDRSERALVPGSRSNADGSRAFAWRPVSDTHDRG